ncbi:MAG: flagellar type III secretion system pore protein FliP [Deltaproteobacteria bacterium]|nr:flagellar type III secretion system pore protein FliP [Deltaproteobacteria bacterium]MBW1960814.1 flagellar type III secretion system pore protein FliP [Deltaproteobacteria bacterium]MBW1994654.1 flagellar type III secretion system pore protein FliP [Deltaproteobacteria bacterium]MBW2151771.1 flagellar type III secretion system pore protein FliP [Deltaproteobacteria bacterium]
MKTTWLFKQNRLWYFALGVLCAVVLFAAATCDAATPLPIPSIRIGVGEAENPGDVAVVLQVVALLTILTLAPAILILMTSFTRLVVVFHFLRQAMGTQQSPPNQVLIGLSLFITFFIMSPVWHNVYGNALRPFLDKELSYKEAFEQAKVPVRSFMLRNTRERDLALFVKTAQLKRPLSKESVPLLVLIPAFVISELKTAFIIGFVLYVPFLVIDMVVASVLLSMGMMMLPPIMISLPFKLMLFVLVDGWNLVVGSMIRSFGGV